MYVGVRAWWAGWVSVCALLVINFFAVDVGVNS